MFTRSWPVAILLAILIICITHHLNTREVSSTLRDLPVDKAKYYSDVLENTNKGLPSVGLNVKAEVTYEHKTK